MKKAVIILFAILLTSSISLAVEDLPIFREWIPDSIVARPPVYHWTLDNGLEVLFWENHTVPLVACRVMLKAGGAFENKYLGCGISHYLEHLVSSGTTSKHTEDEYKMMVQKTGASTNAYTTSDVTVYHNTGPAKYFDTLLSMLSEWVQDCQFDSFEVIRETGVITNEIKMGEEESGRVIWKLSNSLFYKVSPYKHPTIGYLNNFLGVERNEIIDYYQNRYAPNNAIVAIAGDLDTATVKAVAESLFGNWERKRVVDVAISQEPLPVAARVAEKEMDVKVTTFMMGFPTVFFGDDDLPALQILGMILSAVPTSRLDLRLVQNDNPLCHSISAYSSPKYRDRGHFRISGAFDYENRDKVISTIWDEINKVKNKGVTKSEINWAKDYIVKSLKRENETVDGEAGSLLYTFLNSGKAFDLDFSLMQIQRVTREDIQRVAKKYLIPEHMILAIVKPNGATCSSDTLLFSKKSTEPPKFEVRTLSNGIRVVLAENPAQMTEDISMYIMGGSIYEPLQKAGLAQFTVNYLSEGTKKYKNFESFQRKLDELNIQTFGSAGTHTVFFKGNFVPSDLDNMLDIIEQMIFYPTFPKSSENKLKEGILAQIRRAQSSWASEAFLFFNEKFFKDHPYGKPGFGYEETVVKLTSDNARNYWHNLLNPENIVIAAAGPIPIDVLTRKLEKIFGKLSSKGKSLSQIPITTMHTQPEEFTKDVDRKQYTLIVGYDACDTRNEQDKWALKVASKLLSGTGGLSGWLPIALRGERNLVYVVWASYSGKLFGGNFYVATQCQPHDFDTVKAIIFRQIDRLKKGDFTDEDIERITNAMAEQYIFSKQRQSALVDDVGLNELYGFGIDYSDKYPERIQAVTKDDVVRVVNKYFGNPVIAILKPNIDDNK